jgi:predicted signal transduction protein with EAL and GGDEF domain
MGPFEIKGQEVFVTASIGTALGGSDQDLPAVLLRNADLSMYQAKDAGKARYEMFEPDVNETRVGTTEAGKQAQTGSREERAQSLLPAKVAADGVGQRTSKAPWRNNGQTIAAPVVLPTPRIVGAEALIRWEHPERGLVLHDQFVPIEEETGLIIPIGRWVLGDSSLS